MNTYEPQHNSRLQKYSPFELPSHSFLHFGSSKLWCSGVQISWQGSQLWLYWLQYSCALHCRLPQSGPFNSTTPPSPLITHERNVKIAQEVTNVPIPFKDISSSSESFEDAGWRGDHDTTLTWPPRRGFYRGGAAICRRWSVWLRRVDFRNVTGAHCVRLDFARMLLACTWYLSESLVKSSVRWGLFWLRAVLF